MNRIFIISIMMLGVMPVCSQTANYLYITASANAKDKSFHLKDLRKLTFTEEAMTIHVFGTSKTETLPYSNISKLTYTDTGTPIVALADDNISIVYSAEEDIVAINSVQTVVSVQIYTAQGVLLGNFEQTELSLSGFPAGVYIVRVRTLHGSATKKILKS